MSRRILAGVLGVGLAGSLVGLTVSSGGHSHPLAAPLPVPHVATVVHTTPDPEDVAMLRWRASRSRSLVTPKASPSHSAHQLFVGRVAPRSSPHVTHLSGTSVWDKLAQCESGGNWSANTGNGFYGGIQFTRSSWAATGGSGRPDLASRTEQIKRAKILKSMQGWGAWPACSRKLGLR